MVRGGDDGAEDFLRGARLRVPEGVLKQLLALHEAHHRLRAEVGGHAPPLQQRRESAFLQGPTAFTAEHVFVTPLDSAQAQDGARSIISDTSTADETCCVP